MYCYSGKCNAIFNKLNLILKALCEIVENKAVSVFPRRTNHGTSKNGHTFAMCVGHNVTHVTRG